MRTKVFALSALLIAFALISGSASADSVTVQNGNFGTLPVGGLNISCGSGCAFDVGAVPGWTGTGMTGQFEPGGYLTGIPGGSTTIAYINGSGSLSQDLAVDLLPDTTYTLSVWIGDRTDDPGTYSFSLDAGTNVLCTFSGSSASLNAGGFADETCAYTTGSSPFVGDLTVWLTGSAGQSDFADVTVTTTPEPSSIAFESLGLLAVVLFGVLYKRKQSLTAE